MTASESPRVLISGGASGVGLACAEAFAAHGAQLILTDFDPIALTEAADRLGAFSRFCDAIGSSSVDIFAQEVTSLFSSVDVLINAAGRGYIRSLGMAKMTRAVMPLLRRAKGERWIINIECPTDAKPDALFPYASSTPAFRTLAAMFEDQLAGSGIRLLTLAPSRSAANDSPHDALLERASDVDTAQRAVLAVFGGTGGEARSRGFPKRGGLGG